MNANSSKPMTNSQIAELNRQTAAAHGTKLGGNGLGSVCQSYTFGRHQVYWWGNGNAVVRDASKFDAVVFTGTKEECLAWAKTRAK